MTIRIKVGAKGRCRVVVDGSMTIYQAAADKPVLLEALAKGRETEIDLSAVREMDTAGLQLLILVKRESFKAGKTVRITGHSSASRDVLERYNLASYFGDCAVISSRTKKKGRGAQSRERTSRS